MTIANMMRTAVAVPVVRHQDAALAELGCDLLARNGFRVIELTFTVPGAANLIRSLCARHPHSVFGAGTVLGAGNADDAIAAGARFIVSPYWVDEVAAACRAQAVAYLPGGATPGEIAHHSDAGASIVKIFPAQQVGGSEFVKAMRAVRPDIALMPTGGIGIADVESYVAAGAICTGLGALFPAAELEREDTAAAEAHIRQARNAIDGIAAR